MMTTKRNNCTFLGVTLLVVLLPAIIYSNPVSIVEQGSLFKLDPLEELVPEEPLPLQTVEGETNPKGIPILINVDDLATITAPSQEVSNLLPTIATPVLSVSTSPNVKGESLPLPSTPEAPVTKLDNNTPLFEGFVANDVQFAEAPINNLDSILIHEVENEEPINEIENNQDIAKEVDQVKPIIKLLSQKPYKVTYDLDHPTPITSAVAEVLRGDVLNTVELQYSVKKGDESLVPVFEESIRTTSILDHKEPKVILNVHHKEEPLQCKILKKPGSHKKEALLKILDKIINRLLTEQCNLPDEEANSAEASPHNVKELEEISPTEKKLLLQQVSKALVRYLLLLETGENVEKVLPGSLSSSREKSNSSTVEQVFLAAAAEKSSVELPNSKVINHEGVQTINNSNNEISKNYFIRPLPRLG